MLYAREEYTKHYIVQALFKLMSKYEYAKISITDVAEKAGVGRATFYRNFKSKEDVIVYYFERHKTEFMYSQRLYPRCRADYIEITTQVMTAFKQQIEPLRLLKNANLEYLYLDYLNQNFAEMFASQHPEDNRYTPYCYAGMLFNVSMAWLNNDCAEPVDELAQMIVDAVYSEPQPSCV